MRRLWAVVILVLSSRYTVEAQVTNGLVGWWKLDENAGSSAADASGSGHAGTLVNSPTWTNGVSGTALTMGGVKRVDIGPWSGYCLTNAITLSIWVKPVELPEPFDDNYPFFCQGYGYYAGWALKYYGNTNRMKVVFQMTGMNGNSLTSATPIPTNYWTQIAVTFDGTVAKLYLNGQLNRSTTFAGTRLATNDVVTIGKLTYDSFGPGGTFDDARVYNRALSEAEVIQLFITHDRDLDGVIDANELILGTDPDNRDTDGDGYSDGLEALGGTDPLDAGSHPASPSGLVGWWKMDETSGATAADATTNANHGTITGATWTDGILSNALQMATIYNYVTCGSTSTGNALAVTTPTITFWGRVTNLAQNVTVVERWDGSHGYMVQWQGSYNRITPVLPGCGVVPVGLDAVVENEWNHFAFSYNGTQVCSYLNGQLISATTYTNNIGPAASKFYWLLLGQLDDGRVYGRGLSAGEVAVLALADSDGDGLTDAQEMRLGTNPALADTDGDGMTDGWEVAHGVAPTSNDASGDPDGDGYSNFEEWVAGTDPQDAGSYPDKRPSALLTIPNSWAIYLSSNTVQVSADVRSTNHYVTVQAAEVFLDTTGTNGTGMAMTLSGYNSTNVSAQATFTPGFAYGERHELFAHAKGRDCQWSPFQKIILNPNINDILDKIQTNYSRIANIAYTVTSKAFVENQVVRTETVLFRQKGPYKMRWDNQTTGAIAIINDNEIGVFDENGQLTPMFVVFGDDATSEGSKSTAFFWDTERFKTQYDFGGVSSVANKAGTYRFTATPKSGSVAPYQAMNSDVDFRYGTVAGIEYLDGGNVTFRIEQPSPVEVGSGIWFHSQENSTAPIDANWSLRHDQEVQTSTIQINSVSMPDSLFEF